MYCLLLRSQFVSAIQGFLPISFFLSYYTEHLINLIINDSFFSSCFFPLLYHLFFQWSSFIMLWSWIIRLCLFVCLCIFIGPFFYYFLLSNDDIVSRLDYIPVLVIPRSIMLLSQSYCYHPYLLFLCWKCISVGSVIS